MIIIEEINGGNDILPDWAKEYPYKWSIILVKGSEIEETGKIDLVVLDMKCMFLKVMMLQDITKNLRNA